MNKIYKHFSEVIKLIVLITFVFSVEVLNAENKPDTLRVDNAKITKVIEDVTTNNKGNKVTKYYFIYNGELVNTSKTVVAKYKIAKQYGANCALAIVIKGKGTKRIILD